MALIRRVLRGAALALLIAPLSSCGGHKEPVAEGHAADVHGQDHHAADSSHGGHDTQADSAGHGHDKAHGTPAKHGHAEKQAAGGHGSADAHGAAKHGGGHGGDKHGGGKHGAAARPVAGPDAEGLVEIDLGEFSVTQRLEEQESFLMIRFRLCGIVDYKQKDKFEHLLDSRQRRMREAVITVVQGADIEHLCEPGLGWLKGELVPAINKLLQARLLKDVAFADFGVLQN